MLKKIIIYWLAKCLSRTEKALSGISLPDAGQILFISKSIGTVAATAFAKQHSVPARQLLFTPLADINRYVEDGNGLVFYGSGDSFADPDVIADICAARHLEAHCIEGANHSLETGHVASGLKNLRRVMDRVEAEIAAKGI